MSDNQLLNSAEELQKEAKEIIDKLDIISVLNEISDTQFVGSVQNGLMVWRDIDLHAYSEEIDRDVILDLLKNFGQLPSIQKVQFSNFKELRRDHLESRRHLPQGYYVGLRTIQPSGEWKIDIWFGKREAFSGFYDITNFSNITEKQKVTVLKIKKAWLKDDGGYKDGITAVDVYKAVLEHGIGDEEEFEFYLQNKSD